jgi:hypothetical protein
MALGWRYETSPSRNMTSSDGASGSGMHDIYFLGARGLGIHDISPYSKGHKCIIFFKKH